MRGIVLRRVAKQEYDEAVNWFEAREPGLGARFARAIAAKLREIQSSPERFPFSLPGVRRAVLQTFPYTVHYLIETDRIVIVAIFHAKRNPIRLRWRR